MQHTHENYVLRISKYAQFLVMTSTAAEIKKAIQDRREKNGDGEADDLRNTCLRLWKKKQETGVIE